MGYHVDVDLQSNILIGTFLSIDSIYTLSTPVKNMRLSGTQKLALFYVGNLAVFDQWLH